MSDVFMTAHNGRNCSREGVAELEPSLCWQPSAPSAGKERVFVNRLQASQALGPLPCIQQADALRSTDSWDLGCTWVGEP